MRCHECNCERNLPIRSYNKNPSPDEIIAEALELISGYYSSTELIELICNIVKTYVTRLFADFFSKHKNIVIELRWLPNFADHNHAFLTMHVHPSIKKEIIKKAQNYADGDITSFKCTEDWEGGDEARDLFFILKNKKLKSFKINELEEAFEDATNLSKQLDGNRIIAFFAECLGTCCFITTIKGVNPIVCERCNEPARITERYIRILCGGRYCFKEVIGDISDLLEDEEDEEDED